MFNKKFAIGFTVLIIIGSTLGLYHRHETQKILNAEPTKIYKVVDTAAQKNQLQPSVTNGDRKDIAAIDTESDGKVGIDTEVYKDPIVEKANDLQPNSVQQRLKQPSDDTSPIGVGNIEKDSKRSVKESESPNQFRRLTREQMIERAVMAGMPRDQAERMQPLPPGVTHDENLENTLQIISDIIPETLDKKKKLSHETKSLGSDK